MGASKAMDEWGKGLRALQWWLGGITALLLLLAGTAVFIGYVAWNESSLSETDTPVASNPAMVGRLKDAIEGSFGSDLESVEVWEAPFTYDETSGVVEDRPFVVRYKLKGASPTVSGMVSEVADLGESGLDPTLSELTYQLTTADYLALLDAWAQRTDLPVGYVYPYSKQFDYYDDYEAADEIRIFAKNYRTETLWVVTEGWAPTKGVVTSWDDVPTLTCMVFQRDPKTGALTYVGTENAPLGLEEATSGSYGVGD